MLDLQHSSIVIISSVIAIAELVIARERGVRETTHHSQHLNNRSRVRVPKRPIQQSNNIVNRDGLNGEKRINRHSNASPLAHSNTLDMRIHASVCLWMRVCECVIKRFAFSEA